MVVLSDTSGAVIDYGSRPKLSRRYVNQPDVFKAIVRVGMGRAVYARLGGLIVKRRSWRELKKFARAGRM